MKLVSCVVSILLSINNDQVERLLGKLEEDIFETFGRTIEEFRDDVDIKMDGMSQIVNTAQNYVVEKRRGKVNSNLLYTESISITDTIRIHDHSRTLKFALSCR